MASTSCAAGPTTVSMTESTFFTCSLTLAPQRSGPVGDASQPAPADALGTVFKDVVELVDANVSGKLGAARRDPIRGDRWFRSLLVRAPPSSSTSYAEDVGRRGVWREVCGATVASVNIKK